MAAKVTIGAALAGCLKLIAAGIVYPKISSLICIAPATLKCPGQPAKAVSASIWKPKDGKHLVIMRIKITLQCASGKVQSLAHVHQGRIFDSLIAAETYRSSVVRRTGNECRVVSGAQACERFIEICSIKSIVARLEEGQFLEEQFNQAASPAFN